MNLQFEGSTIKAVIFDLGGVLVRTEDWTARTNLATRLGMSREELERAVFGGASAVRATLGEIPVTEHWENVRRVLNLPPEGMDELQTGFWGGDRLDTDLVDFVRGLRANYRTALLTNAWSDSREVICSRLRICDAFDELVISAEIGLAKPDPRIFEYAVKKLKVTPGEALFVDDFAENIESALKFGLYAIQFKSAEETRAEVEEGLRRM